MMEAMAFNTNSGYLEGVCRGYRQGILSPSDYMNLIQCETLDDLRLHLQPTDYGSCLISDQGKTTIPWLESKLRERLVQEFTYMRNHSVQPLSQFLDFMSYSYMIDNVILLMIGTLHQRPVAELLPKCHPLGNFSSMEAIHVVSTPFELYNAVLIDTPLAPFFLDCITEHHINDLNVEVIRNKLYRSYIEKFYDFCMDLGGITAQTMCEILAFEADRRCFTITINSFSTELTKDERASLFPRCGNLNPDGIIGLRQAEDYEMVKMVADQYEYKTLFTGVGINPGEKTLEDRFFEREVQLHICSFLRQFHYGVFYSLIRLREQESRNIIWIAECIAQHQRSRIDNYIPIVLR